MKISVLSIIVLIKEYSRRGKGGGALDLRESFRRALEEIAANDAAYVRIAFAGQPGAGKSSLINAIIGEPVAAVGQATDVTKGAAEYDYRFQRLVDLPGYGTERFRYEDWAARFRPEQYDALVYVCRGKLLAEDDSFLKSLARSAERKGRPVYLVRNHSHDLTEQERQLVAEDMRRRLPGLGTVAFTDCRYQEGISQLKEMIFSEDFRRLRKERVTRAFAEAKERRLEESARQAAAVIEKYARAAGLNGVNPIPGLDVGVDLGIYFKMYGAIRDSYNIQEADLKKYSVVPVAKKLLELLTNQGVSLLLERYAGRLFFKDMLKIIPGLGTAVSALMGYQLAKITGNDYKADCKDFAENVMAALIREFVEADET